MKTVLALLAVVAASLGVLGEAAADGEHDCEIQRIAGGLAGVDDDDDRVWERVHPSLWGQWTEERSRAYLERRDPEHTVEWIESEDQVVYAVHRDLLVADRSEGVVERRHRFPARILALERSDGAAVKVTLEVRADRGASWEPPPGGADGDPSARRSTAIADLLVGYGGAEGTICGESRRLQSAGRR